MGELVVVCPSRGRPANADRLVRAWSATTHEASLVIAVDGDDPDLPAYKALARHWTAAPAVLAVAPRHPAGALGGTLNTHAVAYARSYRVVGFMGDDHLPRTLGWAGLVSQALDRAGGGIAYPDDLFQRANLPTCVFISAPIIRALGWMSPPGLRHLYVDNAWADLGRAAGRLVYVPEVVIEHLHPAAGKASMDAGYQRVNAADADARDRAAYLAWQRDSFPDDAAKVRAALGSEAG